MNKPTPLSRRRLVDVVIDHLRTEIQAGALPAGSRLPPEAQLTVELGVSRTTLREAVVVLSHDGL
jgi:DNA-binding FadR family transcriptional regulator